MRFDPSRIREAIVGGFVAAAIAIGVVGCASTVPTSAVGSAAPSLAASSPATPASDVASPTSEPSSAAPSATGGASASGARIELRIASGPLGSYLTGKDGRTLYVFLHDPENGSTCNLACAETWPPFVPGPAETVAAGPGLTGTLATFTRADGAHQVSYNGRPLYTYSGDAKAGDTNGQGQGSVWSVATP